MHAMRKLIILLSALVYVIHAQAQFSVTAHQEDGTIFLHKYKNRDFPFSNPYLPIWTGTMPLKK